MRLLPSALLLALFLSLSPGAAEAQRFGRPLPTQASQGWPTPWAGIRGGWDYGNRGTVMGGQIRVPIIPSGHVELVPNADVTFRTGLREYQAGLDAVFVNGGSRGGVYAGVGLAWRNTIWEVGEARETRNAPVTVAGVWTNRMAGAPFGTQLEMRWTWVDQVFKPRALTLGINFPLWGRGR